MLIKPSYLTLCLSAALFSSTLLASETADNSDKNIATKAVDEHIEVWAQKTQRAFPTRDEAKAELKKIAGGTNLIDITKLPARQATLEDALGFEPGIIMQSFFGGNDQPRLNIRGSGVQSNPVNRGVELLYDGMALNQADGSFIIGFLDPKVAEMVTVYRGANGLRYGATTLGGAINMISKNGTNASPSIRLEYGSDNRIGASAQVAGESKNWDYYLNVATDSADGYRHYSESERTSVAGNMGFDITDTMSNRTFLQWSDSYFQIPFVVPKARALADPKLVMGDGNTPLDTLLNVYNRKPYRDSQINRIANKTRINQGNIIHEINLVYQQVDDVFTDPLSHSVSESDDIGFEYAFSTQGNFISTNDEVFFSITANSSDMSRAYVANNPADGSMLQTFGNLDFDANNLIFAAQWQAQLADNLQLVAAAQLVNSTRDIRDKTGGTNNQDKDYDSTNPKLGLIYQASDNIRFFANVSSTSEAPTYWELVSASVSPKKPTAAAIKLNDLTAQDSTTIEIGSTGTVNQTQWDFALYRSEVDNELISIVSDFAVNGSTSNYEDGTIHQGLELAIVQGISDDLFGKGDNLSTKLVYNYSDFYFDGGKYDGNQIAGIPEHMAQWELRYQIGEFYIAPSIKWQIDDTPIDHANNQFQDSYTLVSLQMAYQVNKNLKVYFDGQNLTNEIYQTSYVIRGFSAETQPSFLPGFGPSYSLGINYTF
ncbi:MAG: TonB-dependent receptor [Colwellia sp.]